MKQSCNVLNINLWLNEPSVCSFSALLGCPARPRDVCRASWSPCHTLPISLARRMDFVLILSWLENKFLFQAAQESISEWSLSELNLLCGSANYFQSTSTDQPDCCDNCHKIVTLSIPDEQMFSVQGDPEASHAVTYYFCSPSSLKDKNNDNQIYHIPCYVPSALQLLLQEILTS